MAEVGRHTTTGTGSTAVSASGSSTGGAANGGEPSTAQLVSQLTEQSVTLLRNEMKLAQAEMTEKAKHAGVGAGLFGGAGIVALFGLGTLITTVILALSLVMDSWLAALIVTVVLFVIAGIVALVGKKQVKQATPAAPEKTIDNVKRDIETVKGAQS